MAGLSLPARAAPACLAVHLNTCQLCISCAESRPALLNPALHYMHSIAHLTRDWLTRVLRLLYYQRQTDHVRTKWPLRFPQKLHGKHC